MSGQPNLKMSSMSCSELTGFLNEEDVYLRAEPFWKGWNDFARKKSVEDMSDADRWEREAIIDYMKSHDYKKVYRIEVRNGMPVSMVARGVNAIRVTNENMCKSVDFLHYLMTGGNISEFGFYNFILFTGKKLGRNYVDDGDIVIPLKLIKVYKDEELYRICFR